MSARPATLSRGESAILIHGSPRMTALTHLDSLTSLPASSAPVHDALALTQGGVQAQLVLNGQVYTLRITRAGKLILTK